VRRRRELTPAEKALWEHVVRDAIRLGGRRAPAGPGRAAETPAETPAAPPSEVPAGAPPPAPAARAPSPPATRRAVALDPERPIGLDRRTWQRFRRGQVEIEAVLDLHGQTQERAHRRLGAFLARAQAEGRRCVLVVTGKGEASGGVLRHMVPRWLNEGGTRERVLAYCAAHRRHGGAGAIYVLVRRRRPDGG